MIPFQSSSGRQICTCEGLGRDPTACADSGLVDGVLERISMLYEREAIGFLVLYGDYTHMYVV